MSSSEPVASGEASAFRSAAKDDAALAEAVLRKDRKATAQFVDRCADEVYRYVRCRLAPRYDQVDDLVQEVFLAAWKSLPQYRGDGALLGWVMGIARHKVEDYYRHSLHSPAALEDDDVLEDMPAVIADIAESLERDRMRHKTEQVMRDLPEQYRLVLFWRYWEKASAREMAQKTGKTEKAIERLLARARADFRARWNRV